MDDEASLAFLALVFHAHGSPHGRGFEGVREQVHEDLQQQRGVGAEVLGRARPQFEMAPVGYVVIPEEGVQALQDPGQVDVADLDLQGAALGLEENALSHDLLGQLPREVGELLDEERRAVGHRRENAHRPFQSVRQVQDLPEEEVLQGFAAPGPR